MFGKWAVLHGLAPPPEQYQRLRALTRIDENSVNARWNSVFSSRRHTITRSRYWARQASEIVLAKNFAQNTVAAAVDFTRHDAH
jgi:hypothetical protein